MAVDYTRELTLPDHSFFLFGPRGVGKTTWLRQQLPQALFINLLLDSHYMPLLAQPHRLREQVETQAEGWIAIDEVQRLPGLLNEVHDLISRHGNRYKFALSGSTARKLRRMDVNLLAGRAIERGMFPLTCKEIGDDFSLDRALSVGTLPDIYLSQEYSGDILLAYVNTYLRQEIQQEALVKDLGSFHRFLRVAALMHGQVTNIAGIARDAGVARKTVERYFDVLTDTLIGFRLPGWQPRAKIREHSKPKFYFFDPGVVRTLNERTDLPVGEKEVGPLFEGYMVHEVRAALAYQNIRGQLAYWNTTGSKEIDLIWQYGDKRIGFEFKASTRYRSESTRVLNEFITSGSIDRGYVVYRGSTAYKSGHVDVLPAELFLRKLYEDDVLC